MTPELQAILAVLLSPERPAAERTAALAGLADFLHEDDVVIALARGLRDERSLEVRRAMLETVLRVDWTRISSRAELAGILAERQAVESEGALRLLILRRLAQSVALDPSIETLLAWSLSTELDPEIQKVCLDGLGRSVHKTPDTLRLLIDFASGAPASLRPALVQIFSQFDALAQAEGLARLLAPFEAISLRATIIDRLLQLPSLSPAAVEALAQYWPQETDAALMEKLATLLFGRAQVSAASLRGVLRVLRDSPELSPLLSVFENRLASLPELKNLLIELGGSADSGQLKRRLLDLFNSVDAVPFFIACLTDPAASVRWQAVQRLKPWIRTEPGPIAVALCRQYARETFAELREAIVAALATLERFDAGTETALLESAAAETNLRSLKILAIPLLRCSVSDQTRSALLAVFLRLLKDPTLGPNLRVAVQKRLRDFFGWKDNPALFECLKIEIALCRDVQQTEALYRNFQSLNPPAESLFPVAMDILLRFGDAYPIGGADLALKDVHRLATVLPAARAQLHFLAELTGATHILNQTDSAQLREIALEEILTQLHSGDSGKASAILKDAYTRRALKKSHLAALFLDILRCPPRYPLLDDVLTILMKEKVMTPEILDAAFAHWLKYPYGNAEFSLRTYLKAVGAADPSWIPRLEAAFTESNYHFYCDIQPEANAPTSVPPNWNNGWWGFHPEWPLADILIEMERWDLVRKALTAPLDPAIPAGRTLPLILLRKISNRKHDSLARPDIEAIAQLAANAAALPGYTALLDRAQWVLSETLTRSAKRWAGDAARFTIDTRRTLARNYIQQCARYFDYLKHDPIAPPVPIAGMDLQTLKDEWPDPASWEILWRDLTDYLNPKIKWPSVKSAAGAVRFLPMESGQLAVHCAPFAALTPPPLAEPLKSQWAAYQRQVQQRSPAAYNQFAALLADSGGFAA